MLRTSLLSAILLLTLPLRAQPQIRPELLTQGWSAQWIMPPGASATGYGVYHFRHSFSLAAKPGSFIIHVSADNRYRLFVNGVPVCLGPARSDPMNWYFETIDLAPWLQPGRNVLAALVWNAGEGKPFAQMSFQTGFIMQGNSPAEEIVNTGPAWKVLENPAYRPLPPDRGLLQTYIVTGDGDEVQGSAYPWGWEDPDYDDRQWPAARRMWFTAKPRGVGTDGNWILTPREIPLMEERTERFAAVRRSEGIPVPPPAFVQGVQPLTVPPRTQARLLLDHGQQTNAYPELTLSGGQGAEITLTYAEALIDDRREKGHRDSIAGKHIIGLQDRFLPDGGEGRRYRPLWWRSYRYVQLDIRTGDQPLVIQDLFGTFTGYPFEEKAAFQSPYPSIGPIWRTGWRTARLCAGESYFDCPYYEQLQYVGDTRIQALISLYVSGDDRLMRKAITDYAHSFIPEGLTQSRYPSADPQIIPTYSLFWISMLHDYWMHRPDAAFVAQHAEGVRDILKWFEARRRPDGLLGRVEWWNFVDWSWPWEEETRMGGVPPGVAAGGSSILSLQYAYTLRQAADLAETWGDRKTAARYRRQAADIVAAAYQACWDPGRRLLSDTPDKQHFSQHANILAVLTDAVPEREQPGLLLRAAADTSITQATFYFRFYLFEALYQTGLGSRLVAELKPWEDMLAIGLTTFAENPEPTRSDCHAWSAAPVYQLLATTAGIRPAAPGFASVSIRPAFGPLPEFDARMPHPAGMIRAALRHENGRLAGTVELPPGIPGVLIWNDKQISLKPGTQQISLP